MAISQDKVRTIITIPKDLKKKLEKIAKQDDRSFNNLVIKILKDFVSNSSPTSLSGSLLAILLITINWGDEAILYLDGMRYNIMLKIFKMLEATGDGEEGKYEEYEEDEEEFKEFENYDGIEQFDDDFNEEE